jgi:hypothetical protein
MNAQNRMEGYALVTSFHILFHHASDALPAQIFFRLKRIATIHIHAIKSTGDKTVPISTAAAQPTEV